MTARLFLVAGVLVLGLAALAGSSLVDETRAQSAPSAQRSNPNADAPPLQGKTLAAARCSSCHGADGNSPDPQYPKIGGQNADYLRTQLRAFKSGARRSEIMSGQASAITDAQIAELARYFSDQSVKPDVVNDPQLADLGARIFHSPSREAPPCMACHGGDGFGPGGRMGGGMGGGMGGMGGHMGAMPGHMRMMMENIGDVPNLFGQHAAYTMQQLDAFATGMRDSTVMGRIAASLSPRDRRAVAEYLSGLR
ncbi:MAG: c-type cytochrome [Xanthobacteraceae bacterium]